MSQKFCDLHSKHHLIQKIFSTSTIILVLLGECAAETPPPPPIDTGNGEPITTETVDCLLPNQLRSMEVPTLAPRRKVNITLEECQQRAGEVVSDKSVK
jgi:hypothetical protein